jgi:hypothetical protein
MSRFLWPLLATLVASGCVAPPRSDAPASPPPVTETKPPARADAVAADSWTVVSSSLSVRVYRDGPMQKLGHDHLITSEGLVGRIELGAPLSKSSFDLRLPLASLVVDDNAARAAAGGALASPVTARDREATRRNMLGPGLLDDAGESTLRLRSQSLAGGPNQFVGRVRVSLPGRESVVEVPFSVAVDGERLQAHASFPLTHAALGLEPFAVAMGALRVREDFDVDLTLEARRGS